MKEQNSVLFSINTKCAKILMIKISNSYFNIILLISFFFFFFFFFFFIMLYPPKILSVRPSVRPDSYLSSFDRFSSNFAWTLIPGRSGLGLQMG